MLQFERSLENGHLASTIIGFTIEKPLKSVLPQFGAYLLNSFYVLRDVGCRRINTYYQGAPLIWVVGIHPSTHTEHSAFELQYTFHLLPFALLLNATKLEISRGCILQSAKCCLTDISENNNENENKTLLTTSQCLLVQKPKNCTVFLTMGGGGGGQTIPAGWNLSWQANPLRWEL